MQLLYEPKVWVGHSSFAFDEVHCFERRPPILRHQIRSDDADTPADPLRAVHKYTSLRVRAECVSNESGRTRQVTGELGEWEVLDPNLHSDGLDGEEGRRWAEDGVGHGGEDVCYSVRREEGWVFGEGEV